jgi:hypothetical protein
MTEKLYFYDVVDASPRLYVVGKVAYHLNGKAATPRP